MEFFYSNTENRVGDEIQMTAVLRHFRMQGHRIYYQDLNRHVSARAIFPSGLVEFVECRPPGIRELEIGNLWLWAPLLRCREVYTELHEQFRGERVDIDIVLIPCLQPEYNTPREFDAAFTTRLFLSLRKRWPNTYLVIDANKKKSIPALWNVFPSGNFAESFGLIRRARVYIGGDTGTSHYAGAIGHPRMLLLYPDQRPDQLAWKWMGNKMAEMFGDPGFMGVDWDSRPCCETGHMTTLTMEKNRADIDAVCDQVGSLLTGGGR